MKGKKEVRKIEKSKFENQNFEEDLIIVCNFHTGTKSVIRKK